MQPDAPLRRITTWVAILGYSLVASGMPLPFGTVVPSAPESPVAKRLAGKDRSRPFPCMDKPCGCATADQCFTSCCCNTPAETLAWAKAHAVEPAVLAALERRVTGGGRAVTKDQKPSCCSTKAAAVEESCCKSQPAASTAFEDEDLCTAYQSLAVKTAATAVKPADKGPSHREAEVDPRTRTVTLRAMLACGGIVAEWFAAGAALPPPRVDLGLSTSVVGVCSPGDESGECVRGSPSAPPPRAA